jgi:hypothetical protein
MIKVRGRGEERMRNTKIWSDKELEYRMIDRLS